ncbi:MAG TPA: phage/plasmid primase, P4 family [Tepidisphaeraceae bacterium]|nr:phage/plasmid primase, P4 family [Tepidisphaeraceae bacterium]
MTKGSGKNKAGEEATSPASSGTAVISSQPENSINLLDSQPLIEHLHRGGAWGYWFTLSNKRTRWWPVGKPLPVQPGEHPYFGVHPSSKQITKGRGGISNIAAVNCLFAEFDAKDCGGDKAAALAVAEACAFPASVIVDSGGGYHCYWLLAEPWLMASDGDRQQASALQANWVDFVGGDDAAKDLARILRIPGSVNRKYDPPRPVTILRADYTRLYDPGELAAACRPSTLPVSTSARRNGNGAGALLPLDRDLRYAQAALESECEELASMAPGSGRNDRLNRAAYKLGRFVPAGLLGRYEIEDALYAAACQCGLDEDPNCGERGIRATIKSGLDGGAANPPDIPDPSPWPASTPAPTMPVVPPDDTQPAEHHTDLGNAMRLVRLHGRDLRYVRAWGWLTWDGQRWQRDETGAVMRLAKSVALGFYTDAKHAFDLAGQAMLEAQRAAANGDQAGADRADRRAKDAEAAARELRSWAKTSNSRDKIKAMVELAESELPVAMRPDAFDTAPWLLNVANGTLDLHTGTLRAHNRTDLLTKCSPVPYDPAATCPAWDSFLNRIMAGDQAMIDFLQRAVGYSLTGDVRERAFFVLHGTGANGKSTFLEALLAMLGEDYTQVIRAETLMIKQYQESTSGDVAKLQGARLVQAGESEEGQRLAEALVKRMTGRDTLTASFKYHEEFAFKPEFKLFLATNHQPSVRGTDKAIWDRIKLIPFDVTIPEAEQDRDLPTKLLAELPGILAWAVEGCLAWQRVGLGVPEKVRTATSAYRAESDTLGAFLAECTVKGAGLEAQAGPLLTAYLEWAKRNNERDLTSRAFANKLAERGYDKYSDTHTRKTFYLGLGLIQPEDSKP